MTYDLAVVTQSLGRRTTKVVANVNEAHIPTRKNVEYVIITDCARMEHEDGVIW